MSGSSFARFPSTLWSAIVQARDPAAPEHRQMLERLLATYWRPIYAYVRLVRRLTREEAMDATQDFAMYLLDGRFLSKYDRGRGRFRPFLKAELRQFMAQRHRHDSAQKRGGGAKPLSLDGFDALDEVDSLIDEGAADPEEVFERQWARDLMNDGIESLRRRLQEEGKETCWSVFSAFYLAEEEAGYASVAAALGMTEAQVAHHLNVGRGKLREILTERIAQYAVDHDELDEELRALLRL